MRQYILLVVLLLPLMKGHCDEPRRTDSFTSKNQKYQLKVTDVKYAKAVTATGKEYDKRIQTTWGLFDQSSKQQLYSVKGDFRSKSAFISDDGTTIVVVDDWSEAQPTDTLVVVEFFMRGETKTRYSLGDLLCSTYNVSNSSSHFDWFADLAFSSANRTMSLTTYELITFRFDLTTGRITQKERHPLVKENSFLVYGEVKELQNNVYEIEVCHKVYGSIPENGKVTFTSDKEPEVGSHQTVLITDGKYVEVEYLRHHLLLNECLFATERMIPKTDFERDYLQNKYRKINKCL